MFFPVLNAICVCCYYKAIYDFINIIFKYTWDPLFKVNLPYLVFQYVFIVYLTCYRTFSLEVHVYNNTSIQVFSCKSK